MKRLLFVLFALLPMCSFAQRQRVEVQRIEWSMNFGASFFRDRFYDSRVNDEGCLLDTELRYNFHQLPMDVGLMLSYDRRITEYRNEYYSVSWNDNATFMAVSDYNFRRGRAVSCFAGVGVGFTTYGQDERKFCVMPRVGMEFLNFLRITAAYQAGVGAKQNLNITLGLVIGGYRKR